MRLERQSGSDLDFSLNVLMWALQLKNIKGDTVLEIWGRDISHICHRPLGKNHYLEKLSRTLANIFWLLANFKSSGNEICFPNPVDLTPAGITAILEEENKS